jgi:hypothetical protein
MRPHAHLLRGARTVSQRLLGSSKNVEQLLGRTYSNCDDALVRVGGRRPSAAGEFAEAQEARQHQRERLRLGNRSERPLSRDIEKGELAAGRRWEI